MGYEVILQVQSKNKIKDLNMEVLRDLTVPQVQSNTVLDEK